MGGKTKKNSCGSQEYYVNASPGADTVNGNLCHNHQGRYLDNSQLVSRPPSHFMELCKNLPCVIYDWIFWSLVILQRSCTVSPLSKKTIQRTRLFVCVCEWVCVYGWVCVCVCVWVWVCVCESVCVGCSVLSDSLQPKYCSLPGFSVHGIFQARILEWVSNQNFH